MNKSVVGLDLGVEVKLFILYVIVYVCTLAILIAAVFNHQKSKDEILQQGIEVIAQIKNTQVATRLKKGVQIKSYIFTYEFEVDGAKYSGIKKTSAAKSEVYLNKKTLNVVYKKSEPEKNKAKSDLKASFSVESLWSLLAELAFKCLFLALIPYGILAFLLGWIELK